MALTYEEKIAVAKLKAEGLSAYAIFNKLGIQKDKVYNALKNDEELRILIEDFSKDVAEDNFCFLTIYHAEGFVEFLA